MKEENEIKIIVSPEKSHLAKAFFDEIENRKREFEAKMDAKYPMCIYSDNFIADFPKSPYAKIKRVGVKVGESKDGFRFKILWFGNRAAIWIHKDYIKMLNGEQNVQVSDTTGDAQ